MKIRLLKNSLIDNSLELTFSLYQHPLFYRMCSNETSQKISAKKSLRPKGTIGRLNQRILSPVHRISHEGRCLFTLSTSIDAYYDLTSLDK
jgi:hypothetical protein